MRTTITLDDGLLKKRAAESGTSVSGLIERAVRLLLQASAAQRQDRFDLVTFGEGGQFTTFNFLWICADTATRRTIPRSPFATPEEERACSAKMQRHRFQQCFDPVPSNLHTDTN
jgi:predicted GNAT superfamily acetyltransferase